MTRDMCNTLRLALQYRIQGIQCKLSGGRYELGRPKNDTQEIVSRCMCKWRVRFAIPCVSHYSMWPRVPNCKLSGGGYEFGWSKNDTQKILSRCMCKWRVTFAIPCAFHCSIFMVWALTGGGIAFCQFSFSQGFNSQNRLHLLNPCALLPHICFHMELPFRHRG